MVAAASLWWGMAALAVPGAIAMLLLFTLRRRVPDPSVYDDSPPVDSPASDAPARGWWADAVGAGLSGDFFRYAFAASLTTGALMTFGIIGYHLTVEGIVPVAAVPLLYAAAMAVEVVAALVIVGWVYDRTGTRILLIVPVLVALVPALALASSLALVVVGVLAWGFAQGVQDSTVKAVVADLVDAPRRATAYGVFAGIQGALAVLGGVGAGWLYERSLVALVVAVALTQLVALVLLVATFRRSARLHPAG